MIIKSRTMRTAEQGGDLIIRLADTEKSGDITIEANDGAEYRIYDNPDGGFEIMKLDPRGRLFVAPQSGNVVWIGELEG